ncbi:MAG TPA: serine/threonine-protein kinase, partial [Thermoanaerobaculia bacterium]|nr:serine/threonine-protein kinase [Thermoanaerobaculia bacterium]
MIDPQRWQGMDRLFAEALERPPAERCAFLEVACGGDVALRNAVERLLAADERNGTFLELPAVPLLGLELEDRQEQGRLGPYRLLRSLGRGGMGVVYLGVRDDEQYERQVAVKILRSGLEDTELRHRFLAERQILARLEHPNIARLYDGGSTEDGRPYLVMELIEGLPVDEYCDLHRLTVEQRLALFRRICAAVQYAHQNLLVHRDLKPANILVTPEGEPKLLDFGIAKQLAPAAETDARTRTGLRVMTPSHASPEQVKGEAITTASDVYSLGVLLYELLAGRSPYQLEEGAPPYEIERAIHEQQPEKLGVALLHPGAPSPQQIAATRGTKPTALQRRLSGDLDTIVLMALRKEPARRYESVAALSADLERHLQDQPVSARPDRWGYRTRKFVRRHRTAVAAAAAVVLLVAALVASLFLQGRQTVRERDKARYALSFLVDTFKQADPYRTQGETLTAREILDQGAERIARELSGKPDVQAAVMDAIGEVNLGLGRYDKAEPLLTRSLALRRQVFGPASLEVAESLEHLAGLRDERLDLTGAESLLRQALAIRRRRSGGDLATAGILNRLGTVLAKKGVSPETAPEIEALHQKALALARRAEGPVGPNVAETLLALADLQRAQGHYARAESLFREGLAIDQRALGEGDPRLWRERSRLADTLVEAGKFKEAEALFRQCLTVQRKLLGRDHPDVAFTLNGLAVATHLQARYTEAEALEREVLALARSAYGPRHWRVAEALCNLAASLAGQERRDEAIPLYEEALEIRRRALGEKHWHVGQVLLLLAEVHRRENNFSEALGLAEQARDVFAAGEGPDHPYVAHALLEIGKIHNAQMRFAAAEPFLRRCLAIRQKTLEAGHPDLAKAQVSLARCLLGQGREDEAVVLLRAARPALIAAYGANHEAVL